MNEGPCCCIVIVIAIVCHEAAWHGGSMGLNSVTWITRLLCAISLFYFTRLVTYICSKLPAFNTESQFACWFCNLYLLFIANFTAMVVLAGFTTYVSMLTLYCYIHLYNLLGTVMLLTYIIVSTLKPARNACHSAIPYISVNHVTK
jgi:hypothetical protein